VPGAVLSRDEQDKIGIINAGGTMGFDFRYGRVVPPNKGVYWYLDDPEIAHSTVLVDLDPGFEPLDGVDVSPEQWKQISELIFNEMHRGYAGFIVVMGTDSLAYAASATSFALGRDLPVPVMFTGSQAPHAMHHADARVNLLRSIEVIQRLGSKLTEVCVLFGEDVYRAVRVEKYHDYRFNGFHSPSFPALATIGEVPKLTNVRDRIVPRKSASREVETKIYSDFDNNVLRMSLYPGLKRSTLMGMLESTPPSGLVLECLGLGNIPSRGEYDLLPVFDWCRDKNIPVLLTGRYPIAEEFVDQYEAAVAPRDRGALSAGNMTPAAALTKFMWVLARVKDEASRVSSLSEPEARRARIDAFFNESFVGEQDGINES
jgi:L-asparaginase